MKLSTQIKMFPSIFCIYFTILHQTISAYEHVTYTVFNPPGHNDAVFYDNDESGNLGHDFRAKRSMTESPFDKSRPTKKPIGFDAKQVSILAEGDANKTTYIKSTTSPKEGKILGGKIISVIEGSSPVPLFVNITGTTVQPLVVVPTTTRSTIPASGPVLVNVTLPSSEAEIQITKFLDDDINNSTLHEHNITSQEVDHHVYYNSTVLLGQGRDYWVEIDNMPGVKVSDILSQAHRRAVTVKLSFDFPFYGHIIRNITIATGGFLYTGDHVHAWLAATQYIAPLMANFDTSLSNSSFVKYLDNGTAFTVQWEHVVLQEMPDQGSFTFQCTLLDTGDIIFVYKDVGASVSQIEEHQHPVKVGLSDAYIIDRTIFFVRRKTIYEYHRVAFERESIRNWTVIMLKALDTCLDLTNCRDCVSELRRFQCNWCSDRCSNGMDRHRQDWLQQGCDTAKPMSYDTCPLEPRFQPSTSTSDRVQDVDESSVGVAGVIGILLTLCIVLCVTVWLMYAYKNPHSAPGQFLIRYRPSQWTWRRGEARYTAATIHM